MTVELVKSSFLIFVEIKESWLVGIGLKRRWNRKEGRGNKDFKKGGGGKLDHRGGCLKKGGAGTPLRTMLLKMPQVKNRPGF